MSDAVLPFWYDSSQDNGLPNQAPHAAEAIARQPKRFRDGLLADLKTPNTGTPYLTRALQKHLPSLLLSDGVAVPDDPEEMRWRLFFAHSQDMLGFRADIFTGGPNEENNPFVPDYKGLRDRWPDAITLMQGLAELWLNPDARNVLVAVSHPFRSKESKSAGIRPAMELLRGPRGNAATRVFADAFDALKGHKIAHKTNAIIRAYCQNAAVLAPHEYCFRTYLRSLVPDLTFPCDDIAAAESVWRTRIERDFYHVGAALAPYLIADWLFWFWRDGQLSWFDSYKADSVWLKTLAHGTATREAVLPPEAASDPAAFVAYCRTLRLPPEWIPAPLWHLAFYPLPPRVINEVVWLEEAATGAQVQVPTPLLPPAPRPNAQQETGWPLPPPLADKEAGAEETEDEEMAGPERMGFVTTSGRKIALTELHIIRTYAGCLEGRPETNARSIRRRLKENGQAQVILDDGEAILPPLQWQAEFQCGDAVRTKDPDYASRIVVCWFTHVLPDALADALQAVVNQIDYEADAEDFDIMP